MDDSSSLAPVKYNSKINPFPWTPDIRRALLLLTDRFPGNGKFREGYKAPDWNRVTQFMDAFCVTELAKTGAGRTSFIVEGVRGNVLDRQYYEWRKDKAQSSWAGAGLPPFGHLHDQEFEEDMDRVRGLINVAATSIGLPAPFVAMIGGATTITQSSSTAAGLPIITSNGTFKVRVPLSKRRATGKIEKQTRRPKVKHRARSESEPASPIAGAHDQPDASEVEEGEDLPDRLPDPAHGLYDVDGSARHTSLDLFARVQAVLPSGPTIAPAALTRTELVTQRGGPSYATALTTALTLQAALALAAPPAASAPMMLGNGQQVYSAIVRDRETFSIYINTMLNRSMDYNTTGNLLLAMWPGAAHVEIAHAMAAHTTDFGFDVPGIVQQLKDEVSPHPVFPYIEILGSALSPLRSLRLAARIWAQPVVMIHYNRLTWLTGEPVLDVMSIMAPLVDSASAAHQRGGKVHRIVLIDPHNVLSRDGVGMRVDAMICDPDACSTCTGPALTTMSATATVPTTKPFVDHMDVVVMYADTGAEVTMFRPMRNDAVLKGMVPVIMEERDVWFWDGVKRRVRIGR